MLNLNVFLENTYEEYGIDVSTVHKNILKICAYFFKNESLMLKSALAGYEYSSIDFDIVLVNNKEIQRINREYRNKNNPTDVITFAVFADSKKEERFILDGEISLGEIIVSLDKIEAQAKENNTAFYDELYFIISHGILHLLGFDHQTEKEYHFMCENQNKAKEIIL